MLKYSEVKDLDAKAINAKLGELRKELFELRMQKGALGKQASSVIKVHLFKNLKRDIARLKTALKTKSEK